ncbi:hypothetical protein SLEP1_g45176 [Rubroshorea leprosula]|uniref:Uncharacterized protein n=1 Tax=Rubroshorea leprosula TaxID=152421 RepID=A0AAV5LIY5_9ROSI|nr:hypothetical protein SLEP1_g45176 [Rubroshorea leprosula]
MVTWKFPGLFLRFEIDCELWIFGNPAWFCLRYSHDY